MLSFPGALLLTNFCTAFVTSLTIIILFSFLGGAMNFSIGLMLPFLKWVFKHFSIIFWISWGCNTHCSYLPCTRWTRWCLVCRTCATLNSLVSSSAFFIFPITYCAIFYFVSLILWLVCLSVFFLDFLSCFIWSRFWHFPRVKSFHNFDILSISESLICLKFSFFFQHRIPLHFWL